MEQQTKDHKRYADILIEPKEEMLEDLEVADESDDDKDLIVPKEELFNSGLPEEWNGVEEKVMLMPIKTETILNKEIVELQKIIKSSGDKELSAGCLRTHIKREPSEDEAILPADSAQTLGASLSIIHMMGKAKTETIAQNTRPTLYTADQGVPYQAPKAEIAEQVVQAICTDGAPQLSDCKNRTMILYTSSYAGGARRIVPKAYVCEVCQRKCAGPSDLARHLRTHTGERPFACTLCQKTFSRNSHLTKHARTHTAEAQSKRDLTTKTKLLQAANFYGETVALLLHNMQKQQGKRPYWCPLCDAKFAYKGNLKCHTRIHTGVKPYSCSVCGAKFAQSHYLKAHVKSHTGEKPYTCDHCGAKFSQKNGLDTHVRTHTGDKRYTCDQCGAKFVQKSSLIRHYRTHTGDKPFSCGICHATFPLNHTLSIHMRTHTGEKYTCETCEATFIQKSSLMKHSRIHTGDKPYTCPQCEAKFVHKCNLTRHLRTHTNLKLHVDSRGNKLV